MNVATVLFGCVEMAAASSPSTALAGSPWTSKVKSVVGLGRFYEAEYPKMGDKVVVQLIQRNEFGVYVQLLEYNGKVGMIQIEALSANRSLGLKLDRVPKNMRVGRIDICTAMKVDPSKGNMDLAKTNISVVDVAAKEAAFARARAVHSIMRHVASSNSLKVEDLCSKVSWPLHARHPDALEALSRHVYGEIDLWKELDFSKPGKDLSSLADKLRTQINAEVRRRLDQQMLHLRAKAEVSCFEYEGIDAVIEALERGKAASTKDCQLHFRLIAHPLFVIDCTCRRREDGIAGIDAACDLIERSIRAAGGIFRLRSHPDYADHELESDVVEDEESVGDDGKGEDDEDEDEEEREARMRAMESSGADAAFERMKEMLMSDDEPD